MSAVPAHPASAPTTLSKATNMSKTRSSGPQLAVNTSSTLTAKSKKDASKTTSTSAALRVPEKSQPQDQMKKVSRRASKPIINWFQRKLAGTRARRVSDAQRYGAPSPRGKEKQHRRSSVPNPPPLATQSRTRSNTASSRQNRAHSLRGTISLNETNDGDSSSYRTDSDDELQSSRARESLYSPASYFEADEDASVRPIPPSAPPSPSPSRDSSSYLSHSRTFRSMTASTKPTTLLSVDLNGGMAHIAQAPPTPTTPGHRIAPHIRTHSSGPSAGSITFSAFPHPSPTSPSRPSSGNSGAHGATLTAPQYTSHHPRNNPRPSSPPPDDASVLTLASSAFGLPGARIGAAAFGLSGRGSIADDSISQWSHTAGLTDSTSHFMMGDLEEGLEEPYMYHDVDASVRALRPRSSRRGSWDSTVSGWSANVALGSAVGAPSPGGMRSKSMWTAGSFKTGGLSTEEALEYGFSAPPEEEEKKQEDRDEDESSAKETNDAASSAPTTDTGAQSSVTAEPHSDSIGDVQTPPAPSTQESASTMSLPGSNAGVPADLASTATLPGSKAASEMPSPDHASTQEVKSGTSTPTKTESAPVELQAATAALSLADKTANSDKEGDIMPEDTVLSPASATSTEYVSAPSTPAVV